MSDYRRAHVPGGYYFFTLVTHKRKPFFAEPEYVDRLREGFKRVMERHPFRIDAVVILPDHLHTIWRLPEGDSGYSLRWRLIKHYVASGISVGISQRGEKQVWQRRFWEHVVRDESDWRRHVDYVHYNPVKHGLVCRPSDWPYSSFHRAVEKGWYSEDWGSLAPSGIEDMDLE